MAKARKIHPDPIQGFDSKDLQRALTSLGLEGIKLSPASLADLKLVHAGKLSKEEALARVLARVKK